MLACRPSDQDTLTLAAMAPREDVFTDAIGDYGYESNGVDWYYNNDRSWGFAPAGSELYLNSCDMNDGDQRLCWHTGSGQLNGGFRCGDTTFINDSFDWERLIFTNVTRHNNDIIVPADSLTGTWSGENIETTGDMRTFDFYVDLTQVDEETVLGSIELYQDGSLFQSNTIVSGSFDGQTIKFSDNEDRYFWGTVDGDQITGFVSWGCYVDCDYWGTFTLYK
jgi:hypothetical protein